MIAVANERGVSEREVAWTYSPRQLVLIYKAIQRERYAPFEFLANMLGLTGDVPEDTPTPAGTPSQPRRPRRSRTDERGLYDWYLARMGSGDYADVVSPNASIAEMRAKRIPVVEAPREHDLPTAEDVLEGRAKIDASKHYGPGVGAHLQWVTKAKEVLTPSELAGGTATPGQKKAAMADWALRRTTAQRAISKARTRPIEAARSRASRAGARAKGLYRKR